MNPHDYPYGSARFASDLEVLRAFRDQGGVPFGFYRGRKLFHAKQAGMLLIGGAGSGKFTSVLAHIIDAPGRKGEPQRYAIFDPKRELRAVLEPYFAHIKAAVYEINPYFTHGVSGHRLSILSHLTPDSPRLVGDSRRAARTFIAESGGGDARFFEQKAQNWLDPLMRGLVHLDGGVSPTSLYDLVGMIRSAPDAWADMAKLMADIRQFFSTLRTLKQTRPDAPTLNLIIDEAAQLGSFPEISDFYSIGRGFGLCPVCVYQDIGQIRKNLGPTGAMTLSASADLEVYLGGGISDLETARMLSAKLGNQTLELEDHLVQQRAERSRKEALYNAFFGRGDAVRTGAALKALDYEQQHKRKLSRPLRTPEEILGLPQSQALVLALGYGVPPFVADKTPYFTNKAYRGLYAPNPYFDRDLTSVNVPGSWGGRKALRVIREPVPASHAHLPQYQSGEWTFIEGHRP